MQREPGRAPHFLTERPGHGIGNIGFAPLEHRHPGRDLRDHLERELLHARRLAPVALEGLEQELDARRERDEAIGPGADRVLLEALLADLLDVFLGDDPAGARGRRAVEGHEVGPRLLELEADTGRVRRLHRCHPVLENLRGDATIPLERELHVLRGDRLAVVEAHALAQDELVDEPVGRHAPRLGQARSHALARHGLEHRVVKRVEHHERRDEPRRLGRLEERRRQREVQRPGDLARRRLGARFGSQDRGGPRAQRQRKHAGRDRSSALGHRIASKIGRGRSR